MTHAFESSVSERLSVGGVELEVVRRGAGRPVLLLHGAQNVDPRARFLDLLGQHAEIVAPSHPGFGSSARPADFETVYDLVHLYLESLEALPYEKVTLVGLSFGGWLAAEIAVTCGHRLDALVLVDAFGIKISDRETPDILDVFNASPEEVKRRSWHTPGQWAPDYNAMSDEELVIRARNWDALCLYGAMARAIDRRTFFRRAGTVAAVVMGAPLLTSSRATAASDRLVVAVGQWGTETPFAWRTSQSEKPLWDCIYDPLIMRDPKTFEYRPGLATS